MISGLESRQDNGVACIRVTPISTPKRHGQIDAPGYRNSGTLLLATRIYHHLMSSFVTFGDALHMMESQGPDDRTTSPEPSAVNEIDAQARARVGSNCARDRAKVSQNRMKSQSVSQR